MTFAQTITRRGCLALGAGAAATVFARPALAAPFTAVVELFSSQACDSCPQADRLLGEIGGAPGVLAMTFHVDYWDYLGWKDTLASKEFSQRQYDYAKARGDMDVYTPQMIVNGQKPLVGNQRSEVYAVVEQSRVPQWPVPVTIGASDKEIVVDLGSGAHVEEATLWVMAIQPEVTVKIEKGSIAGSEVTSHNVVRRIVPAGMWNGNSRRIALPKDGLLPPECTSCAALLQQGKVGRVLGAALWQSVGA